MSWQLRRVPVCGSTEWELERWLAQRSAQASLRLERPRGVLAQRQRFGQGQHGRRWQSPPGGVWLSAALPWAPALAQASAPGLAVAVGLLHQLEALGLEARLKWPNDLLLRHGEGHWLKLAGLLSGWRVRGSTVRWARVGVGLNGCNPVPPGATNLVAALGRLRARPRYLLPRVLQALEWAMEKASDPDLVTREAEERLWLPSREIQWEGEGWQIRGLNRLGGLAVVAADGRRRVLHHPWPEGGMGPYIVQDSVKGL